MKGATNNILFDKSWASIKLFKYPLQNINGKSNKHIDVFDFLYTKIIPFENRTSIGNRYETPLF